MLCRHFPVDMLPTFPLRLLSTQAKCQSSSRSRRKLCDLCG